MNILITKTLIKATEGSIIIINGRIIENVKEYTYLGQQTSATDIMSKEIDTSIGKITIGKPIQSS